MAGCRRGDTIISLRDHNIFYNRTNRTIREILWPSYHTEVIVVCCTTTTTGPETQPQARVVVVKQVF